MTDESVMMMVCRGDLDQLSVLFKRYQAPIFNLFLRLTADRDLSHDLTQNTFMRIMKYRGSYRENSRFRPWIYQIARNVHATHYHKQRDTFADYERLGRMDAESASAQEGIERKEMRAQLHQALGHLPSDYREVIILSKYQGLKYDEIAQVTDTTEGAVKVKVHRALKSLREVYFKLEKQGQ